jgi:hypothetical protein
VNGESIFSDYEKLMPNNRHKFQLRVLVAPVHQSTVQSDVDPSIDPWLGQ